MRVNVYAAELTGKSEIVQTVAANMGARFEGIRFLLKTHPDMLKPIHSDNDDSGVTFWIQSGREGTLVGDERFLVRTLVEAACKLDTSGILSPDLPDLFK